MGSSNDNGWLALVREVLGALAGLAAVVYIAGGFIVGIRLASVNLPTASVVGQLPRDFLLSIGVSQALFPAIFLAAVYAALRSTFSPNQASERMKRMFSDRTRRGKVKHLVWSAGATAAVMAPAILTSLWRNDAPIRQDDSFFWFSALVIASLTFLGVVLFLNLRARLARRYATDFKSVTATVLHSLLVAAVIVPGCVAFWGYWPLQEATVCMTRSAEEPAVTPSGYLVGETKERVYVGDSKGDDRRITSVPTSQVRRVVLGPGAAAPGACD